MKTNIKIKLLTGLGFLALLVLLLWSSGLIFINILADNSSEIIRNNHRTVTYMQNIEQDLQKLNPSQLATFDGSLQENSTSELDIDYLKRSLIREIGKQQQNITELGEAEISNALQDALLSYVEQFERYRITTGSDILLFQSMVAQYGLIQDLISEITYMNLEAMEKKNDQAQQTASNVILYMTIIGAISTLLAVGLLIKYPNYIVTPIRELIDRIKKIANQNYDQRLEFNTGDEFEELAQAFNTMATKLQEYESSNLAKLKNEKQHIESIINQVNEAVVGLDHLKNILFVNKKAEDLLGLSRDRLVGQYAPDVASTNDLMRNLIQDVMNNEYEKQKDDMANLIKIAADGRHIYYSKESMPVLLDDETLKSDKQIGTIITLKNVTHFQEMSEAKTNFVAVVSHELKTPIASISMSLRLLEDERVGPLNEEQAELIKNIHNDTSRMKRTTAELLNLSKIETGNIQLNSQQARPLDLMEYAFETMVMQADQKDIGIEIECDYGLTEVKADMQKSVWVLVNLISNAVRYTPPKGKIILKAEDDIKAVRFSVIDNGRGIPEEYLDKIFQKYFQVYKKKNDNGGSGLGLAIAKEFITAQGGEIGVESTLGKGSTFYFTLPKTKKLIRENSYET